MDVKKGAGYSIEAILASLILFGFALNAVQVTGYEGWSEFQREIAAKDISYVLKETGNLETFLKNSDTGALQSTATAISDVDMSVSGTVEDLPIKELQLGFHKRPPDIHWNDTVSVADDDFCDGDLDELEDVSEASVRRTQNGSGTLEDRYGVRLYLVDSDPSIPGGFNGQVDYDSLYVDNGTRCVFRTEEGPYYLDDIFYWGNKTDADDGKFFDFKQYVDSSNEINIFEANRAVRFDKTLSKQLNGIDTDTSVDTFNFSTADIADNDVLVFTDSESLDLIQDNALYFKNYMNQGSALFLMNLTETDLDYDIMEDIGFQWFDRPRTSNPSRYTPAFSQYSNSQVMETYFMGLDSESSEVSLGPGGRVISGQGPTQTSGDDLLFARNSQYNVSALDGEKSTAYTWSTINTGQPCTDTETSFTFYGEVHDVRNLDLAKDPSDCGEIRGLMIEQGGSFKGPYLEDEVVIIDGRRYVPRIQDSNNARFVFAGTDKIELINHRTVFENMTGERIARTSFEEDFSEADRDMLASLIYWLRGDTVRFTGGAGSTSIATSIYGGINEDVYMPYTVKMRWED